MTATSGAQRPTLPDPATAPTLSILEAGALPGIRRIGAYGAAKNGELPTFKLGKSQPPYPEMGLIPAEPLADEDARELVEMAVTLTGTPARLPYTGLSVPVPPGGIRSFLESVLEDRGVLYGAPNSVKLSLDGQRYQVPGLAFSASNVVLHKCAELEALADEPTAEALATCSSTDDTNVVMIRAVDELGLEYRRVIDLPEPS